MRKALIAILAAIGLLATVGSASAVTKTFHATYEIAPWTATGVGWSQPDPVGVTGDGWIDVAGVTFDCPADHHAIGPISQARDGCGEWTAAQASIVDDVWGAGTVVGAFCIDLDHSDVCGEEEKDEPKEIFCGTSSKYEFAPFHEGYFYIAVWGTYGQALSCDPTAAPTGGTTGGILNPHGGIYLTLEEG